MEGALNYEKDISRTKRWMGAEFITGLCFLVFMLVDGFDPLSMAIVLITSVQLIYGFWKISRLRNKKAMESV